MSTPGASCSVSWRSSRLTTDGHHHIRRASASPGATDAATHGEPMPSPKVGFGGPLERPSPWCARDGARPTSWRFRPGAEPREGSDWSAGERRPPSDAATVTRFSLPRTRTATALASTRGVRGVVCETATGWQNPMLGESTTFGFEMGLISASGLSTSRGSSHARSACLLCAAETEKRGRADLVGRSHSLTLGLKTIRGWTRCDEEWASTP